MSGVCCVAVGVWPVVSGLPPSVDRRLSARPHVTRSSGWPLPQSLCPCWPGRWEPRSRPMWSWVAGSYVLQVSCRERDGSCS